MNKTTMTTWETIWFAVGITLSNATQLRPAGLPIGPGDVMVFAWMLLVGFRLLIRQHSIPSITKVIFLFWLVSFSSISLGFLIAESKGLTAGDFDHDGLSFVLAFVFSITFSIAISSLEDVKKLLSYCIPFTIFSLSILLFLPFIVPFINPWYGEVRFTGWAENPNQMALQLSMIPFFALHLLSQSSKRITQLWYILLIIASLFIGRATGSDALITAWASGFSLLIVLKINRDISNSSEQDKSSFSSVIKRNISQVFFATIVLLVLLFLYTKITAAVGDEYNKGAQGDVRITLWMNGIAAIAHSPIFGLGPGSQSGFKGPFLNFEAHNTFIDWAGDSGIVGLFCYVALLGWVGWNAWKNKLVVMVAAIISIVGFSMFHYVLRPPIFWFYLLAIATLSTHSLKESDPNISTKTNKKLPGILRY